VGESAADPRRLRVRSGLAFVQVLRPALYVLLVLSALFTFWSGGPVAGRTLPRWTQSVAPTLFAVFLLIFTVYRFALMRAKKYPAATGLFQVGLGALIWVLPPTQAVAALGLGNACGMTVAGVLLLVAARRRKRVGTRNGRAFAAQSTA